jgi:hypothetical protein
MLNILERVRVILMNETLLNKEFPYLSFFDDLYHERTHKLVVGFN